MTCTQKTFRAMTNVIWVPRSRGKPQFKRDLLRSSWSVFSSHWFKVYLHFSAMPPSKCPVSLQLCFLCALSSATYSWLFHWVSWSFVLPNLVPEVGYAQCRSSTTMLLLHNSTAFCACCKNHKNPDLAHLYCINILGLPKRFASRTSVWKNTSIRSAEVSFWNLGHLKPCEAWAGLNIENKWSLI